jgi:hypothetical protein
MYCSGSFDSVFEMNADEAILDMDRDVRLADIRLRSLIEQSDGHWLHEYAGLHASIINGRYSSRFKQLSSASCINRCDVPRSIDQVPRSIDQN